MSALDRGGNKIGRQSWADAHQCILSLGPGHRGMRWAPENKVYGCAGKQRYWCEDFDQHMIAESDRPAFGVLQFHKYLVVQKLSGIADHDRKTGNTKCTLFWFFSDSGNSS